MNKTPHYLVIGAGIAGLSCARLLHDAGFGVTVVDKSRGPGGRMSTRRGADWACDHGAQYFTARDPAFGVEVERWQREGVAALWQPRLKVFEGTVGHTTDRQLERFVGLPRMTAPARLLAEGLSLQTALTAVALHRESAAWQVETAEKGRIDVLFDGVILAVPAAQALPLLAPVSPVLAAEARAGHMAACWAMLLRFDTMLDLSFDAAFVNRGPLRWVARDSSKPGRDGQECWSLHASAEWSEARLEEDAETVAPILIEAFKALGGALPQAWAAHRWRYAITDSAVDGGCVWHAADGLGLCGDWLNGGRVEGAWLSGRAVAQQVLSSLVAAAC